MVFGVVTGQKLAVRAPSDVFASGVVSAVRTSIEFSSGASRAARRAAVSKLACGA